MNMSYCKFENTARDLSQCLDAIHETGLSSSESEGRQKLLELCKLILDQYNPDVEFELDADADEQCEDCGTVPDARGFCKC